MTTLPDRPNTALMVIDVQQGNTSAAFRRDDVVTRIRALVDRARAEAVPVVWVQHAGEGMEQGSEAWHYAPELVRLEGEALVHKRYGDAFEDTDLEQVLSAGGIGRLVVTGAQTEECIRATIHGGFTRGYDVTLVSDAHTTEDQTDWGAPSPEVIISFANLYWQHHTAPGRTAAVTDAQDVEFSG